MKKLNNTNKDYTWEDLVNTKSGTILHDEFKDGMRFIITRSTSSLCAYIGVPSAHPLAKHDYSLLPIDCHGGLTYCGEGDDKYLPAGYYFYGWDYSHGGDYAFYYSAPPFNKIKSNDKKWLIPDIVSDSWIAISQMKDLMKLAEEIKRGK